jgi:hypothetical protein
MKLIVIAATTLIFSGSFVLAQNASTGSTTTTGDSAISPATPSQSNSSANGASRLSPGTGINSGAMNNGTTGDTIGTGPGTASGPAANPGRK